ncbi:hypothetical protein GCM10010307_06560 [Streptomyces vastus]|uniref:Uncharacterized protein n=1 Tax=Streptomyces vastus TaxID=285451 RepID=A0ABP6CNV9_9ACTN
MGHALAATPDPTPRANAALAADCQTCNGWGSVLTCGGRHELCPECQSRGDQGRTDSSNAARGE